MAQHEDAWDALVNMYAGRRIDGHEGNVKWVDAVRLSMKENYRAYEEDQAKEREVTRKMQRIVDLETELALTEGQTIVRGRRKRPIRVIRPKP
jgi:hypothetical protein